MPPTAVLSPAPSAAPSAAHPSPATVRSIFRGHRHRAPAIALAVAALAACAAIAHGGILLTWDEPIQRFVEGHRTATLDSLFLAISRLGSTVVVLGVGTAVAAAVWHRCRAVSIAVVVVMLGRPLFEATLKALVDRDRPDFERLVDGTGPSFPSGHPMAATALYGFIPVIVALYTNRRRVIAASWIIAFALIGSVAASRIYLGVHWFSDVVASILLASFLLVAIEWTIERGHRKGACGLVDNEFDAVPIDPSIAAEIDHDLAQLESQVDRI